MRGPYGGHMQRREFITLLGSAAATWPLAARGQHMRRIGVLMYMGADDAEGQARLAAFAQGLKQLGWTEGHKLRSDIRWASDNANDVRRHAADLVALAPDVILANGTPTAAFSFDKPGAALFFQRPTKLDIGRFGHVLFVTTKLQRWVSACCK